MLQPRSRSSPVHASACVLCVHMQSVHSYRHRLCACACAPCSQLSRNTEAEEHSSACKCAPAQSVKNIYLGTGCVRVPMLCQPALTTHTQQPSSAPMQPQSCSSPAVLQQSSRSSQAADCHQHGKLENRIPSEFQTKSLQAFSKLCSDAARHA